MNRKTWLVFVGVQIFGELGPWVGLHMKSFLGPVLWGIGFAVMVPGRFLSLFVTEKLLWNVSLIPHLLNTVFVVVEVVTNLVVWLLCVRVLAVE